MKGLAEVVISVYPGDDITRIQSAMLMFGEDGGWREMDSPSEPYEWDTTEYLDGILTIYAKVKDEFAWSEVSHLMVEIDNNDPPLLDVTSPTVDQTFDWNFRLTGSVLDEEGFDVGYGIQFSWDGTTWTNITSIEIVSSQMISFNEVVDTSLEPRGKRTLRVWASDGQESSSLFIIDLTLVWFPDLSIPKEWLSLDPPEPKPGEECLVNVTVSNEGDGITGLVNVNLKETGTPVYSTKSFTGLEPGESTVVQFTWIASEGPASFFVIIDEDDDVEELDELNNVASTTIRIIPIKSESDGDITTWLSIGIVMVAASAGIALYAMRRRSR
jgi:hypothetical protein